LEHLVNGLGVGHHLGLQFGVAESIDRLGDQRRDLAQRLGAFERNLDDFEGEELNGGGDLAIDNQRESNAADRPGTLRFGRAPTLCEFAEISGPE
jgi:hypothetical protein